MLKKIITFLMSQPNKIRLGGWLEAQRKAKIFFGILLKFPFQLICFLPALLIVLTIRLIRPIILIRFERIICWRLGHFSGNIELYLCELDAGINKPKVPFLDIWYYPCAPCNHQLARMWNRILHIGPANLFGLVSGINDLIPGGEVHQIGQSAHKDRDVHNLLDKFPPHLSFLPQEERLGQEGLRLLGIPKGVPFVCLAVRDDAYLQSQSPHLDWSRHDYRDCDIQNYILTSQRLVERGYYVLRMGAVVKEAMKVEHPMIIDYAARGLRNDFMDIYLGANCAFCISSTLGFDMIPMSFRRPVVFVDCAPLELLRTSSPSYLSTVKKYWLREQKRYMTFKEIFISGAGKFVGTSDFKAMDIELIESTPEEILAVVLEMDDRLKNQWKSINKNEKLQQQFFELLPKKEYHGEIHSRIGSDFLRQNQNLLL